MIGQKVTGRVTVIIKKGRFKFGFIHIGPTETAEEELPRIYFSFEEVQGEVAIRNKYQVEFTCRKDEQDRAYAAGVVLTPAGQAMAVEREALLAASQAAREAKQAGAPAKKERAPRERKPREERNVMLRVTCEGSTRGEQRLEVNVAGSVGKLKNIATTAFDAPLTHNVFLLTEAEPKGVFLTRTLLAGLETDARVHLGAPTDEPAAASAKA